MAARKKETRVPIARIVAKRAGFRRCGVAHPATPTIYYDDDFTPEQLKQLMAEPMLVVDVDPSKLPAPEEDGEGDPDGGAGDE